MLNFPDPKWFEHHLENYSDLFCSNMVEKYIAHSMMWTDVQQLKHAYAFYVKDTVELVNEFGCSTDIFECEEDCYPFIRESDFKTRMTRAELETQLYLKELKAKFLTFDETVIFIMFTDTNQINPKAVSDTIGLEVVKFDFDLFEATYMDDY